ncbi:MAG: alpha/beta fold hydrolase [Hyphomicrobiales bacterium]|nr:alpha/beta fold hydrolase [Hyphomicrobiales bacterium]
MTVRCGGLDIACLRAGAGEPLLLLHGIGSAALSWQAQLESLSASFDVIAWNAPGYGASTPLEADAPTAGDYAEVVAQLLDALAIKRCRLAGHSLGSLIAARFAATHGERVSALTLASCALGHATHEPAERLRLLESRLDDVRDLGMRGMAEKRGPRLVTPQADPQTVRFVVDVMASANPHGYTQAAKMLSGGDMLADIARIDPAIPVQVIYGTEDVITPPAANEKAAAARKKISVVAIPAAGHLVYVEQPETFNSAIASFGSLADAPR